MWQLPKLESHKYYFRTDVLGSPKLRVVTNDEEGPPLKDKWMTSSNKEWHDVLSCNYEFVCREKGHGEDRATHKVNT